MKHGQGQSRLGYSESVRGKREYIQGEGNEEMGIEVNFASRLKKIAGTKAKERDRRGRQGRDSGGNILSEKRRLKAVSKTLRHRGKGGDRFRKR